MKLLEIAVHWPGFDPSVRSPETRIAEADRALDWAQLLIDRAALRTGSDEPDRPEPRDLALRTRVQGYLDNFHGIGSEAEITASEVKVGIAYEDPNWSALTTAMVGCGWFRAGRKRPAGAVNTVAFYKPGPAQIARWAGLGKPVDGITDLI